MLREAKNLTGRFHSLRRKHSKLESEIAQEEGRPMPDTLRLRTLKAIKLRTREQIERIARVLRPSGKVRVAHPI